MTFPIREMRLREVVEEPETGPAERAPEAPGDGARLEDLAAAAQAGDGAAADALYRGAHARLTRIALALGASPDDTPDLVQEALLAGWRHLERFDPRQGSFVGWLVPGLKGRLLNRRRGVGRKLGFLERFGRAQPSPEGAAQQTRDALEARLTVSKLLAGLTDRQREVVALYELGGLSARETASLLGIGESGVRSIARDARRRLHDEARRLETPRVRRIS